MIIIIRKMVARMLAMASSVWIPNLSSKSKKRPCVVSIRLYRPQKKLVTMIVRRMRSVKLTSCIDANGDRLIAA